MALRLSYSAITAFRHCQQQYKYGYIDRLRPRVEAPPLELGTMLHFYLETYYKGIRDAVAPYGAHTAAISAMIAKHEPICKLLAQAAMESGATEEAALYADMVHKANVLSDRYYTTRGEHDAGAYQVLYVEEPFEITLSEGVVIAGVIDKVTRDDLGNISVWEHKSTKDVPPTSHRLRDLQTLIYAAVAEMLWGLKVESVTWNYLRTKLPEAPKLLKAKTKKAQEAGEHGGLSRDKSADTTWHEYQKAIEQLGLEEDDYADVRERLLTREMEVWYPRYVLPRVADERILFRDMVSSARHVAKLHQYIERDPNFPVVRNLTRQCDWCGFNKLCTAAITGGYEQHERERWFVIKPASTCKKEEDEDERERQQLLNATYGSAAADVDATS